jgi:hypothetical protein
MKKYINLVFHNKAFFVNALQVLPVGFGFIVAGDEKALQGLQFAFHRSVHLRLAATVKPRGIGGAPR